jgi:LPS export ABC transporter protein LptC
LDWTYRHIKYLIFLLLGIPGVSFLISCENDIERINLLTHTSNYPDLSGKKVEMIYSDSGRVRMQLTADEIRRFARTETPFTEFPKGLYIRFFDDTLGTSADLTAGYAIYYNKSRIWEARGNVTARNYRKGEVLNSEELFWDENKEIIYSNIFTRIENKDGTFYGENGFEADQTLTRWKLKGSRGTVRFKENEPPAK